MGVSVDSRQGRLPGLGRPYEVGVRAGGRPSRSRKSISTIDGSRANRQSSDAGGLKFLSAGVGRAFHRADYILQRLSHTQSDRMPHRPPTSWSPRTPGAPAPPPRRRRWSTRQCRQRLPGSARLHRDQHGHLELGLSDADGAFAGHQSAGRHGAALATTIVGLIRAAQSPVILVGTEIQRYGLADKVADLIAKLGVRWASALLSKSTLRRRRPRMDRRLRSAAFAGRCTRRGRAGRPSCDARCVFPNGYAGSGAERVRPHGADL